MGLKITLLAFALVCLGSTDAFLFNTTLLCSLGKTKFCSTSTTPVTTTTISSPATYTTTTTTTPAFRRNFNEYYDYYDDSADDAVDGARQRQHKRRHYYVLKQKKVPKSKAKNMRKLRERARRIRLRGGAGRN